MIPGLAWALRGRVCTIIDLSKPRFRDIVQLVGLTTFEQRFSGTLPLPSPFPLGGPPLWPLPLRPGSQSGRNYPSGSVHVGMKLYVGNLSYEIDNASLEELFAPYGSVRSAK